MSDDSKMARILARAAQMQQARDDEDRLVLLEDAAAEVGIDRAMVRRAALEHALDDGPPPRMLGVPTRVVRRRWIDADVAVAPTRARLLARLDTLFCAKGERVEDSGHATWTARHIVVTLQPEAGGTLVQISERFVNTASASMSVGATMGMAAGAMVSMMVLGLLGKGLLAGLLAGPIVLLALGLGVQVGRVQVKRKVEAAEASFERALESLDAGVLPPKA
ncbi:MAG: hypothetical protein ACE37F_30595 [Nannocystaceae bacterium]|nr:hypothetical protein [bacterium]